MVGRRAWLYASAWGLLGDLENPSSGTERKATSRAADDAGSLGNVNLGATRAKQIAGRRLTDRVARAASQRDFFQTGLQCLRLPLDASLRRFLARNLAHHRTPLSRLI